jgi:hypothetical protein
LHLPSIRLQERDELREGVGRKILAHFQHHGLLGEQRDWGEIVDGVVAPLFVDRLVVCVGASTAQHQRIAVGRGADHAIHPDDAAGAGRVLDNHLLAQELAHLRRNDTAYDVESAARRKRHHHDDRPCRIGLRLRRDWPERPRNSQSFDEVAPLHVRPQIQEKENRTGSGQHSARGRQQESNDSPRCASDVWDGSRLGRPATSVTCPFYPQYLP